ncbi:MAG: polysulfide reductase NrfD [Chloroflexi bacterium]|nr:polysulfide reductase NrfD [Chloroflexota bacterium]
MLDRPTLTAKQINDELLWPVLTVPRRWIALVLLTGAFVAAGVTAGASFIIFGLGVTGLNRPVFWGFMIVNFVFWVGISHAGTMISSILRLSQAEWRRPVTRAAETMTVFALMTSLLHPVIHAGRPWRIAYWVFGYDFWRGIWPNVRSPLVWDPAAIITYLTGSILFVYTALIPDLANIRDRTTGWQQRIYGVLSLGWRGTPRQWKFQGIAGILLSAIILPVFVSVHSIVSWDFAVSIVPAWHASIFAPYFVLGAVHSGVAAVILLMALMRWIYKMDHYIWEEHFDNIGRLLIAVATAWFFALWLDITFALYSGETQEVAVMELRIFTFPYNVLVVIFLLTAFFIPVPLWLSRRVRRNIPLMVWTAILVNIGMWLERFLIIVPGLSSKQPQTFMWNFYSPSLAEAAIVLGSFGLVGFLLLLFSKVFPLVPVWEQKEGQVFKTEITIGNARVPAILREEASSQVW